MDILSGRRIFTSASNNIFLPTVYTSVSGDYTIDIPAGYTLEYITFLNSTTNTATLSLGLSLSTDELFSSQTIVDSTSNNGITTISLYFLGSLSATTHIYLHDNMPGDSWNSASLSIYLSLKPMI